MNHTKLLIIEDEIELSDMLKQFLEDEFTHVEIVKNGLEGRVKILEDQSINVVLCDVNMPKLSGIELLKSIREAGKRIPFVLMTAQTTIESQNAAMDFYSFGFLNKPFTLVELKSVMSEALAIDLCRRNDPSKLRDNFSYPRDNLKNNYLNFLGT